VEPNVDGFEIALALALEAAGYAIDLWEEEGEVRFRSEFDLSHEQVDGLDHEWRIAYLARERQVAALAMSH
jgi:hypothetical protein